MLLTTVVTVIMSVTLLSDTPFGTTLNGLIQVSSSIVSVQVSFSLDVVSSTLADVLVFVEDEFTYYAEGKYFFKYRCDDISLWQPANPSLFCHSCP